MTLFVNYSENILENNKEIIALKILNRFPVHPFQTVSNPYADIDFIHHDELRNWRTNSDNMLMGKIK